ncbi:MAG: cellulase family glycosylhydrolase, partial [Phycisphaerae bacterium]
GKHCLLLDRPAADADSPCETASPTIKLAAGTWELAAACRSDLNSPDNSYNGAVTFECLDGSGKVRQRVEVGELFGKRNWQAFRKRVELPAGTVAGRFRVRLSKAGGQFRADELSAAKVAAAAPKDTRISRVLFATAQLGNLLLPQDSRAVQVTVECTKPLGDEQKRMACVVRDYWGAEYSRPIAAELTRTGKGGGKFLYGATVDLDAAALEVGKYYELHAAIPQPGGEPFTNYTSLAILPQAVTKAYKPEEIPFTSRNWDNRITAFIRLTDRLGVRICGIWGGWSADPPYKPHAPQIELCAKLGMGVLTGTPAHAIETHAKGYEKYDEKALRQGVRNFIEKYGKTTRPLIINLGNEPHGTGDRVRQNVAAYRALYEEIKATDPNIFVLGTSVGPQEEYFQNGFQKWCDGYDFHIYEDSRNVRRAFEKYRALFARYGGAKPVWSTEVGLNSQGMTRQAVAVELVKKFSVFFAAGGRNVSWFGLLYPDRDGTSHGSSGDSHNVFDCRYNRYCPRLDAVAYYNMVNAICIKRFIAEKTYADGISALLFRDRDGRDLIVLWKDKGRQDVRVPLAGAEKVLVIRIDGARGELDAAAGGGGVTLTVSEDPLLL